MGGGFGHHVRRRQAALGERTFHLATEQIPHCFGHAPDRMPEHAQDARHRILRNAVPQTLGDEAQKDRLVGAGLSLRFGHGKPGG